MDFITLSAAQTYSEELLAGIQSGIKTHKVSGTTLTFEFNDGTSASMTFNQPANGRDGKDGKDGKPGENATAEQILAAVTEYMNANPIQGEVTKTDIESAVKDFLAENVDSRLDEQDKKIVEITEKVGEAIANTIDTPFTTAYWKDSSTDKVYLVKVVNGVLTVEDTDDTSGLEGLLPDRLLIWHDEFEGDAIDTSKWIYEIGGRFRGNPSTELQYYTDNNKNVYLENSILHLKAIREDYQGKEDTPYTWTSGAIETKGKFAFGYGRVEARMKMVKAEGSFPAFWLLGDNYEYKFNCQSDNDKGMSMGYPWSNCGEIDIVEQFGNSTTISSGIHRKREIGASNTETSIGRTPVDVTQWHTYALERTESQLDIYVDNIKKQSLTLTDSTDKMIFTKPMYILFNNCIGSVAGTPNVNTNEFDFQIDYVRYYAPTWIIKSANATNILLNKNNLSLLKGKNELLEVTFEPNFVDNMSLNWVSDNESVCTACGGYIKSVGIGNANVTVSDRYGHRKTCAVTVVHQAEQHTMQFSITQGNLTQYAKIDGETGENDTTTTSTVYGTKDYIDVANWDRCITGIQSSTQIGGFYIYEYDADYNYLGRVLLYTNDSSQANCGNKYNLKENTTNIKVMITGMKSSLYYTLYYYD